MISINRDLISKYIIGIFLFIIPVFFTGAIEKSFIIDLLFLVVYSVFIYISQLSGKDTLLIACVGLFLSILFDFFKIDSLLLPLGDFLFIILIISFFQLVFEYDGNIK